MITMYTRPAQHFRACTFLWSQVMSGSGLIMNHFYNAVENHFENTQISLEDHFSLFSSSRNPCHFWSVLMPLHEKMYWRQNYTLEAKTTNSIFVKVILSLGSMCMCEKRNVAHWWTSNFFPVLTSSKSSTAMAKMKLKPLGLLTRPSSGGETRTQKSCETQVPHTPECSGCLKKSCLSC